MNESTHRWAWVVLLSQTWEISHMMIYIISNEMYSFSRTEAFLSQFLKIQDGKGKMEKGGVRWRFTHLR